MENLIEFVKFSAERLYWTIEDNGDPDNAIKEWDLFENHLLNIFPQGIPLEITTYISQLKQKFVSYYPFSGSSNLSNLGRKAR